MEKKGESGELKRELGLFSVVFFIFGYVVGAGILIQAGVAASITGPALWVAFIIAGIPALLSTLIIISIVSSFPVSGGTWVYSSRLGSPLIGFIVLASTILHIIGALALLAVGFANYFELFIPNSKFFVSIFLVIIFFLINVLGVKIAVGVQVIMAICGDFLFIILFIVFGLPKVKIPLLLGEGTGGMFPTGIMGVFMGAVILSFSYAGFMAIIEIGGEIKNPKRNIPLGLVIGFIMVAVVYILISIVMIGNMDWRELENATMINIAEVFLPDWFLIFLNILVLIAIASTFHGIMLAYSRDLFAAAKDKMVPEIFGKLNKNGIPHWSAMFIAVGTIIMLFFVNDIVALSVLCSFTITIPTFVFSYIPLKMDKFKELTESSKFNISRKTLLVLVIAGLIYSTFSIIVMIIMEPLVILSASIFYASIIGFYYYRKNSLKKKGIDIHEICKKMPKEVLEIL